MATSEALPAGFGELEVLAVGTVLLLEGEPGQTGQGQSLLIPRVRLSPRAVSWLPASLHSVSEDPKVGSLVGVPEGAPRTLEAVGTCPERRLLTSSQGEADLCSGALPGPLEIRSPGVTRGQR